MPAPYHSFFYRPDALPDTQQCQSTEGSDKGNDMMDIFVEEKGEQCRAVRIVLTGSS